MNDALHIPSITGVDLALNIAGPGGRSYAYVVDWHIRLLLALAWYVVGTLILVGSLSATEVGSADITGFTFVVIIPAAAIYFLYHPVLEVLMQGRTPGKRIAGVRIVTRNGDVPGVGAILIRNVLRIVDSLPGVYVVGLAATVVTKDSVRIGDMAAGTLLVYEDEVPADKTVAMSSEAIASVGLEQLELVQELIDRWDDLHAETRMQLGLKVLARHGVSGATTDIEVLEALRMLRFKGAGEGAGEGAGKGA